MTELAEEAAWAGAAAEAAEAATDPDPPATAVTRLAPHLSFVVIAVLSVVTWAVLIIGVALMPMWAAP